MKLQLHRRDLVQPIPSKLTGMRVVFLIIVLATSVFAAIAIADDWKVRAEETPQPNVAAAGLSSKKAIRSLQSLSDMATLMQVGSGEVGTENLLATELHNLTASDGAASDRFGFDVAISGNTLVAGAFQVDVGGNSNQGAAYVFVRSGGVWTQQAKLTASDGTANDFFGQTVAISENTIIIGAPNDSRSTFQRGSVYIFVRSGTTWNQQAKLFPSGGTTGFGSGVAIEGDTAVIGAQFEGIGGSGAAYVFVRSGSVWTQQARLEASDSSPEGRFGASVGLSGDTAVIGAPLDDVSNNENEGSVYVFVRSGTVWTQQAKLNTLDNAAPGDEFGHSVTISNNTIIVGEVRDDPPMTNINQGSASVFIRSGTVWTREAKLIASNGEFNDQFGHCVAISEDTAVITSTVSQRAWIFSRIGSSWSEQRELVASDGELGDAFGRSAAISEEAIIIGADNNFIGGVSQGSAYVYPTLGTELSPQLSGRITDGINPLSNVQVALSGDSSTVTQTDASGDFLFANLTRGNSYVVTPALPGYAFVPTSFSFANLTSNQTANFTATTALPNIINVLRTYEGSFLKGFDHDNNFDVRVDWRGSPGRVRFQINNNVPFEVQGNADGVIHPFNIDTSFPASFAPSTIKITPINGENIVGAERTEEIFILPYPAWLQIAAGTNSSALTFSTQPGEVRANFNIEYPREPYRALIPIPSSVPFIGGQFGVRETQGRFNGFVSSTGSGNLTLTGSTGFVGMNQQLDGSLSGSGEFLLNQNGLSIPSASFNLDLSGTVKREVRLIDAIPFLSRLNRFPAVKRFGEVAKLRGELKPSFNIALDWKQDPITQDLVFNEGTGTIGVEMKGVLSTRITDRIGFEGWVAGGGSVTVGAPAPFARRLDINFEAGAQLNVDDLFGGTEFKATIARQCTWIPADNEADCSGSDSSSNLTQADNSPNSELTLVRRSYENFGSYESFNRETISHVRNHATSSIAPVTEETLVSNVFAGAEPTILPVGDNGKMLLWVRQNTDLPVLQSTEIAWSYYDGTGWTTPAVIVSDTRAEFSPVAGVDVNGKVVAAWLKIRKHKFNKAISTFDKLPLFYREVEIVSAVFDPDTRTWSAETSLTSDQALDTSLRLATDKNGKLLLTWQSNKNGQLTADTPNSAALKYSFWNGSSWNAPASVAVNLSNISEHAVAINGNNAFIVLPVDPSGDVNNDSKLFIYRWNGTDWSQGSVFAEGGVENQVPTAVYDTGGEGRVIWLQGTDLVQATLSNTTPQIVRQGSESAAFHNVRLVNNATNNLTLIWQEVADNGPANIFVKIYEPTLDVWGEDRRLNQDARQSRDATGYYDLNGNLQLVYLATEILRVIKTVTIDGQSYEIPNVPHNGQTDLSVLTVNLSPASVTRFHGLKPTNSAK